MSFDPLKRDSSWQMILPGCYIDRAGYAHLFPHEFLAYLSAFHPEAGFDPNSFTDYDLVVKKFKEELDRVSPGFQFHFVEHQRQDN